MENNSPENSQPAPTTESSEYPVSVNFEIPTSQSRVLALFSIPFFMARFILLIPHLIVLSIVQFLAFVVAWFNLFAILFTGHSSPGMLKFVAGSLRWSTRMSAYTYGVTDKYPPFKLGN